jgi:hypothetical protein
MALLAITNILYLPIAQIGMALLETILTAWTMDSNKFFYGILQITREKGRDVCTLFAKSWLSWRNGL